MFIFRKIILLLVVICMLFASCDSDKGSATKKQSAEPQLPPPPIEVLNNLFQKTDFIDYMFDDLTFSVSVGDQKSVKGNISYLTINPVADLSCTKPLGTVYFQSKGEHLIIARSYFSEKCAYFILNDKNNRPLYACEMSPAGKTFFNQIVNQTKTTPAPKKEEGK